MQNNSAANEAKSRFDVTLSGGPPWGFTLTGGSEFGSKLCVKKVADGQGILQAGDEIISVNGVNCTSRANAIQMVHSLDDELTLNICRCNNVNTQQHSQESQFSGDHLNYNNMIENMNDLTKSSYSLKKISLQSKHCNNNTGTSNGSYQIISINRDSQSNQHNIQIAIPDSDKKGIQNADLGYNERFVDMEPTDSSSSHQLQKIAVRVVPASKNKQFSSNAAKTHLQEATIVVHSNQDQTDSVAEESLQKVSTARAMFENMSSKDQQKRLSSLSKTQLKSWKSSSLLENDLPAKQTILKPEQPLHKHSKSLPTEMAGKEYEKAVVAYKQQKTTINRTSNKQPILDRPKSAHYSDEEKKKIVPNAPAHYSQSDILRSFRSKSDFHSTSFEQQITTLPSYSSEDLRSTDPFRGKSASMSKNDSANELRQAANRYHQELMKNYPKFRHSIKGMEHAQKFQRKASMPAEDAFSRGKSLRATIATVTTTRMPRSLSTNDTEEMQGLHDALAKTNDNSMMSRLLRDQSSAILMKIDEETARGRTSSAASLHSRKGLTEDRNTTSLTTTIIPEMKSICIQTDPEQEPHTNYLQMHRTSDVQISTEINNRDFQAKAKQMADTISNMKRPKSASATHEISTSPEPPTLERMDTAVESCIEKTVSLPRLQKQNELDSLLTSIDKQPSDEGYTEHMHIETDIDSVEAEAIMHRKNPSMDSAIYMMESSQVISHLISSDNIHELTQISDNENTVQLDNTDFLPPPPYELLQEDKEHEELCHEKEKPQRTINRKKKDSYLVSSRNNSCVSTDSTTSTATADSGIVIRSDMSPRTSPSDHYYNGKDLSGSRETLDDDVADLNEEEPHATSTPERYQNSANHLMWQDSVNSPLSGVAMNTSANIRPDSMNLGSPKMDDLDHEKSKLIHSMREKINELRDQEQEITDEIRVNEELGKKVLNMVESKATQSEFSKFELFIGELNKIVALLLSLTQRLHRYELMLQDLDMSNEADKIKKDSLLSKIEKLKSQHEEACYLRDVNDKRGDNVATFLEKYCAEEEFADFQYYVDMKSQLALMQSEIREKVKLGEERLKALEQTGSEWGFG